MMVIDSTLSLHNRRGGDHIRDLTYFRQLFAKARTFSRAQAANVRGSRPVISRIVPVSASPLRACAITPDNAPAGHSDVPRPIIATRAGPGSMS